MKVYCVIDAQNDFIDGVLGSAEAVQAVDNICDVLSKANHKDDYVICTKDTHYDDYLTTQEGKYLPVPHCTYGTEGWLINQNITDEIIEFSILKSFIKNTFGSHTLEHQLEILKDDADEIIFMGFCTDICVVTNALMTKMACPEVPIKVIANCCAGTTPEMHEKALDVMRSCQIDVVEC